jgi:hypothetical protein
MHSQSKESKLVWSLAHPMAQPVLHAGGIGSVVSDEPAGRTRQPSAPRDILLLHTIVTFRDADSGITLAGKIVGRTAEAEPKYDIRVGPTVYADIPAPRIGAVGGQIVPRNAKRLP